jgi:glyoxylase-like metal-dependent hydrolase (beta-lactamase superfamily II)
MRRALVLGALVLAGGGAVSIRAAQQAPSADALQAEKIRDNLYDLYYFGRAHTGGDAWVVFPALRVLHAGDAFPGKGVPPLDANNGASGVEYPRTIAKAIATLKDIDTVITGHYQTTLTMADVKTFGDFVREFVEAVQSTKHAGRTIDDFVREWKIPERFVTEGYASTEHLRSIKSDVEVIWNETK